MPSTHNILRTNYDTDTWWFSDNHIALNIRKQKRNNTWYYYK